MAGENINRRLNIYVNEKEVTNSMRGVGSAMNQVRNQIRNLDASAEDYDEQLRRLTATYRQLETQHNGFRRNLQETSTLLGRIRNALGPVAPGFLAAFSITAVISKANQVITEGWQTIVKFNQKQADLAAIMGKSRTQVAGLTLDAMRYGATTSFTASQVSELQTELARLGKTEAEIKKMTKGVLNAAVALEADLGPAAELIGGQLNAFGEDASKSTQYADVLANSVNISATSFESLSTALPKVSKVADQEGVSFERLNAILGVLADENIAAETAGTGFRNILLESAEAGLTYEDMLKKVANSSNQSKTAMELFGKENAVVAVTLANSTEKIEKNTKALENSAGAAEQLAATKLDSLQGSIKLFSSAWEGFLLSLEKGDGFIAKAYRGIIDLGTSFLSLITPMQKGSDLIMQQQTELNVLAKSVTSLNENNKTRKSLLIEIQQKYPNFLKNLDIEKVTNADIAKRLSEVNKQYREKIRLTAIDEELQDNISASVKAQRQILNDTKSLNETAMKFQIRSRDGSLGGIVDDAARQSDLGLIPKGLEAGIVKLWNRIQENQRLINSLQKQAAELQNLGQPQGSTDLIDDPEVIKANEEKPTGPDEISEEEKKKRQKAIDDAKKHSEDLKKEAEKAAADLLALQRNNQDLSLGLFQESFDKERELINVEYDRKIQDVRSKVADYQTEIDTLNASLADPKNTAADTEVIKKSIAAKLDAQKEYSDMLVLLEQTRDFKIAALRETYAKKELQQLEANNQEVLKKLQNKHLVELNSIQSLEEAKLFLQDKLSEDELRKVKTLADAKVKIKEFQLQEEYELQKALLIDMMAMIQQIFTAEQASGITLISEEERAELLLFMDQLAEKLNALKNPEDEGEDESEENKKITGVDLLGFRPEQWKEVFENLDDFQTRLEAVQMVTGAMTQAFSQYFAFLEAGERRALRAFEDANRKKKAELADRLEKGFITQEIYNAKTEKLEIELARKKAELEIKAAKRNRLIKIAEVISSTSVAIMQAYAQLGPVGGTIAAVIVGTLGALQLNAILKEPLPSADGYRDGGFTPFGDPNEEAGVVHKSEYVIPKKVLFSNDPAIPAIMSYLEAKRTGRGFKDGGFGDDKTPLVLPAPDAGGTVLGNVSESTLNRLAAVLERLEEKEFMAYLVNDLRTAKKIRDQIRELEKIENQSKK